ncbi:Exodeoxyribonuclease V beta chain (fragment) [Mesorhizobium prunaredense]|uniref:Exodeoxyribonuclease V beta chain n=1 Tax=Mesorhizobium prunaredense TaxID=1631249 RepID=A0A1R3V8C4_9HYPH
MFREAEAERVADICARLIGNVMITRTDGSRTPLCAGDIALLSPGHTELWRYERELERLGLAVSSQAGLSLMRRQETQDVLALLRVLADSSDTLAFGALMRGPLVGLTEQDLLDITAALPSVESRPGFFTVRTDPALVRHPLAKSILEELQTLRSQVSMSTPALILAEAIERLNARVIVATRHRNRNARAIANLDALVERARVYGVSGLHAFVRDLQADWESKEKAAEGRVDAAEHAIELVTIHSAKGLEWPVVILINSTTELYRPDQFVHRQSDNSLHWMLGGISPPDLAAARAEESMEEANQRERIWYVACTRARDLLILPHIPQATKNSWFSSVDLGQQALPELEIADLTTKETSSTPRAQNNQSKDTFALERQKVDESAPHIVWRRPSDHDQDRLGDSFETIIATDSPGEIVEIAGAGVIRGIILHKLMEEFLTGELPAESAAATSRGQVLLSQLVTKANEDGPLPDPVEMSGCALRAIALPEIAALRPLLVPELSIWAAGEGYLLSGRADAMTINNGKVGVVIDWKSDIGPSAAVRSAYAGQLKDYLAATGTNRGMLVFLTTGEITEVQTGDRNSVDAS